jgi:hypothetical protein
MRVKVSRLRWSWSGRVDGEAGYATLAPGWPDDPDTVEEVCSCAASAARRSLCM